MTMPRGGFVRLCVACFLLLPPAATAVSAPPRQPPQKTTRREWALGGVGAALVSSATMLSTPRLAKGTDLFDLEVPLRGTEVPLSKFRGTAHLVVNVKMDDPLAGSNFVSLRSATGKYAKRGLRVWAFPTDQGYYEPDVAELIRYKAYQQFGFGQYPVATLFDKIDVVGKTVHPLYATLTKAQRNPNGLERLSLNFEKFLLDDTGAVLRRYPRKFTAFDFDDDLEAACNREPLPPPSTDFVDAWKEGLRDAQRGEYSFRSNYNVYDQARSSSDWEGLAELSFQ